MDETLTAPIVAGQKVGEIIYKVGDQEIIRVNLVSEIDIKKANFLVLFFRMIGSWLTFWK